MNKIQSRVSFCAKPLFFYLLIAVLAILLPFELLAQTATPAAAAQPSFGATLSRMLPMFVMIFFIFYFLVIRPQDKKLREHQALLSDLKKGEMVVTSGGIIGRIASIEDDSVYIELGTAGKLRIEKTQVTRRYKKEVSEKTPVPSTAA